MDRLSEHLESPGVTVVYDGHCPFCSRYVMLTKLRESAGPVRLVDARGALALAMDLSDRGYDLNEGMIVIHDGQIHYGSDAMHALARLSGETNRFSRLSGTLFASRERSGWIYPWLRRGRKLLLKMLGRRPIDLS